MLILAIGAAHAQAAAASGTTADTERYLFGSPSTVIIARSVFYGLIAAAVTLGLVVVLMTTLPHLFPVVYGGGPGFFGRFALLAGPFLLCLLRRVAGVGCSRAHRFRTHRDRT